jgi:hypothetical protein
MVPKGEKQSWSGPEAGLVTVRSIEYMLCCIHRHRASTIVCSCQQSKLQIEFWSRTKALVDIFVGFCLFVGDVFLCFVVGGDRMHASVLVWWVAGLCSSFIFSFSFVDRVQLACAQATATLTKINKTKE